MRRVARKAQPERPLARLALEQLRPAAAADQGKSPQAAIRLQLSPLGLASVLLACALVYFCARWGTLPIGRSAQERQRYLQSSCIVVAAVAHRFQEGPWQGLARPPWSRDQYDRKAAFSVGTGGRAQPTKEARAWVPTSRRSSISVMIARDTYAFKEHVNTVFSMDRSVDRSMDRSMHRSMDRFFL